MAELADASDLKSEVLIRRGGSIPPPRTIIQVTVLNKVIHFANDVINFDDCWIYSGPAYWDEGYPIINRYNKNWIASRFVWFLFTGRDYYSKEVHHKCKIRACVNPFHLEELTKLKHRRIHSRKKQ